MSNLKQFWFIGFLALLSVPFYFILGDWWQWGLLVIGFYLGAALLIADELWLSPWYGKEIGDQAASLGSPRPDAQPVQSDQPLQTAQPVTPHLLTRSVVFLVCYIFLAIFVVTSTGSRLGIGLVLGMGVVIAGELWQRRQSLADFQTRFGWQTTHQFSDLEQRRLIYGFIAYVALLAVIAMF